MSARLLAAIAGVAVWLACRSAVPTEHEFDEGTSPVDAQDARWEEDRLARGVRLYDAHCAVCHGEFGAGDGPASPFLFPEPRDFTRARFRLVSTENGVPTRDDLVGTLRRGIPGSAMPAWRWMDEEDLDALAALVRSLAVEGVAFELFVEGLSGDEAFEEARARLTPGPVLPRVAEVEPTGKVLDLGRALYRSHCASCHGTDGSGRAEPRYDEDGSLNWPRDFTAGYLKGGSRAHELGWRIQAGLPGSTMPRTELGERELEALVAHLRTLIPPDAETNRVHRRRRIVAHRVDELPLSPTDERWSAFEETPVVLAPLRTGRQGSPILSAHVGARHDGERVAVRVRWADASGNLRIYSDLPAPDACALQLSADEYPRLFGMGSGTHRTSIWHWKALRLSEVAGGLDLLDHVPHAFAETFRGEIRTDVPVYQPSASLPFVSETVESMRASGIGRLAADEDAGAIDARPSWVDGEWSVVFSRPCEPASHVDLALRPGTHLNVALAIWNGSAGDRGARKSISIWQVLELEP